MPFRRHNLSEPICGKCGYCVRGITSLTCPECGSDLREVGIITPNTPLPLPKYVKAIFWTLLLPVAGFLLSMLMLATILPYAVTRKVNRVVFCQQTYMNTTLQVFATQRLSAPALAKQAPPAFDEVTMFDQSTGNTMVAHLTTGAYVSLKGNRLAQSASGFNSSVIAQWASSPITNANDPRVKTMCDGVYAAITETATGNAGKITPILDASGKQIGNAQPARSWVVHDEPHPAVIAGLCVFWLAIWLYGIRRIFARRGTTASPAIV
jgi:hypothetical protein